MWWNSQPSCPVWCCGTWWLHCIGRFFRDVYSSIKSLKSARIIFVWVHFSFFFSLYTLAYIKSSLWSHSFPFHSTIILSPRQSTVGNEVDKNLQMRSANGGDDWIAMGRPWIFVWPPWTPYRALRSPSKSPKTTKNGLWLDNKKMTV